MSREKISVIALVCLLVGDAQGQLNYTGGLLRQSFDTLPSSGTLVFTGKGPQALDLPPVSAAGTEGWRVYARVGSPLRLLIDSGSVSTPGAYCYGRPGSSERALGSQGGSPHVASMGLRLVNATGQVLDRFYIAYVGEQWRRGSADELNYLDFGYRINATAFDIDSAATFTLVPALRFDAMASFGMASEWNGNLPENRRELVALVSGITWAPGATLVLRWRDFDERGSDDGLAIDDVLFYAPTTPHAPQVVEVRPANEATEVPIRSPIYVTFNQPVTAEANAFELASSVRGAVACSVKGGPMRYEIRPEAALIQGEHLTLTVRKEAVQSLSGETLAEDYQSRFSTRFVETVLGIHQVQGVGNTTPLLGRVVTVQGVVTANFQGAPPAFGGFYMQTPSEEEDGDPETSQGLFVSDFNTPGSVPVEVGDRVQVTGTAAEVSGRTQLNDVQDILLLGKADLPAVTDVVLEVGGSQALEAWEGMRVRFQQPLYVTSNSDDGGQTDFYAREGQLFLSAGAPLVQPTEIVDPNDDPPEGTTDSGENHVFAVTALAQRNQRSCLVLDDGSQVVQPDPTPYLNAQGTRRVGDSVMGLTGILEQAFGRYRLQPLEPPVFVDSNPRPAAPTWGGRLKVASMNLYNYFTTLNERGATNAAEFQRQRTKLVEALAMLNADILGLIELENSSAAVEDLLTALNERVGEGTYAVVPDAAAGPGPDTVRLGFFYKPAIVALRGPAYTDTHTVWQLPTPGRPPLAQVFMEKSSGERLIVCVNHFKSKSQGAAAGANYDRADGQGFWNDLRRQQALRLDQFLTGVRLSAGDNDVLIMGDLNAYGQEDPVDMLRGRGWLDLAGHYVSQPYSYHFGLERGRLDHALGSTGMASQVTQVQYWPINSDEPPFYDYNLESKSTAQQAINADTLYRSSDHDPVLVSVELTAQPTTYAMWAAAQDWPPEADTSMTGDADGDGLTNFMEFALASDPLAFEPTHAPRMITIQGALHFEYRRFTSAVGVRWRPQRSDDLVTWQDIAESEISHEQESLQVQLARVPVAAGKERQFFRLIVELL